MVCTSVPPRVRTPTKWCQAPSLKADEAVTVDVATPLPMRNCGVPPDSEAPIPAADATVASFASSNHDSAAVVVLNQHSTLTAPVPNARNAPFGAEAFPVDPSKVTALSPVNSAPATPSVKPPDSVALCPPRMSTA